MAAMARAEPVGSQDPRASPGPPTWVHESKDLNNPISGELSVVGQPGPELAPIKDASAAVGKLACIGLSVLILM